MPSIFCLTGQDGKLLEPAVQATVLAKYSRSPLSAKEILSSMTLDEADKFNDKWVIGYGHSSVAELASVPICIEGLSIIASKVIETVQRGAFSEKSTRYQRFSGESFVTPPGGSSTMKTFASHLYETYDKLHDPMVKRCAILMGKDPADSKSIDKTVRARAFDNLRYLLPAGTGTNVACVLNFRDARDLVSLLLGHPNSELQEIGKNVLSAISEVCPVLMRHATPNTFELRVESLGHVPDTQFNPKSPDWYVELVSDWADYQKLEELFIQTVQTRYGMDWESFTKHMETRPEHLGAPEIFKTIPISFDIMMDYGAFRDLQRHRRCEQFVEPLTTQYGYVIPDDIAGSELESEYVLAMDSVSTYSGETDANLLQYVIPLGYLHRSRFQMTLQELYYIVELRTRPHGHMSYRRVAYRMFELAESRYPRLMKWCRAHAPTSHGEHC